MRISLDDVTPVPNLWFSESVEYKGNGRAEFECPIGSLQGPTTIAFDRSGRPTVTMKVETVQAEKEFEVGPIQLLYQDQPRTGSGHGWSIGGEHNTCKRIEVTGEQGTFKADGKILTMGHKMQLPAEIEQVSFLPIRAQYEVTAPRLPKYWVLPLSNFLSEFCRRHPALDRHPLRIYPTPEIRQSVSENNRFLAEIKANEKNRLIIFEFNDTPGFIEALPDYEDRKSRLEEGKEKSLINALMVGELHSDSLTWLDLEQWFPFKLLDILSFVTGTHVGASWIEFRDEFGGLVRRFHASMGARSYTRGHRVIREDIHHGIGSLLTRSLSSPEFGKSYLHVALKHLVRGGSHEGVFLEDRYNHLARALEGLAKHFKLDTINLLDWLTAPQAKIVREALRCASKTIMAAAKEAASGGREEEAGVLGRIATRVKSGPTSAWDFGQGVTRLLGHFGFPDAQIVERYYAQTPRLGGRAWAKTLSQCRATVMHGGSFDFNKVGLGLHDVFAITSHLHDALTRIILKSLGYEGSYQPTVAKWVTDAKIDWVKISTPAIDLGYEGADSSAVP